MKFTISPEYDLNFQGIKVITIKNLIFSSNKSDPNILVLISNKLYLLNDKSIYPIAVLADVKNNIQTEKHLRIRDIHVFDVNNLI